MPKFQWLMPALALFVSFSAIAEDREIAGLFTKNDALGTMVIASFQSGKRFVHNDQRANQRFPPASTFKVLNTLIALEEKAVSSKDDSFRWSGEVHDIPAWNQDQTLGEAFRNSCVWCYQQLARKIGAEKYRRYLKVSAYGALREPFDAGSFWLDGSLEISATEQVEFLERVYRRSLPFGELAYETLRQVMLVEATPTYKLWAKTGLAGRSSPEVGWYIGYVETASDAWFFATNLEIHDPKELPLRQALTREVFRTKGILE